MIHALNTIRPTLLNEYGFNFSRGAILSTPIGVTNKANNPDINAAEPFANTQGVVPTRRVHGRNFDSGGTALTPNTTVTMRSSTTSPGSGAATL